MAESLPARHASGRYQLLDRLGAGGMGVVYRALDRLTGAHVALKRVIISADDKGSEDDVDTRLALAQEFQTLATLRHPYIISVLDYGFNAVGQPFFTMDLLDAPQTVVAAMWDKPLAAKIDRLVEMLQALAYLHRRGILHRDLKPANVLVAYDQIKLLDFGLSQDFAPEQSIVGTPAYMAPEILRGDRATPAADLYAVGVLAYELIAGRHPFDTSNVSRLIADVINTPPDLTRLAVGLARFHNPDAPPESLPEAEPSTGSAADALEQTAGPGVLAPAQPADLPDVGSDDTTRVSPAVSPAAEDASSVPPGADATTRVGAGAAATRRSAGPLGDFSLDGEGEPYADQPLVAVVQRLLQKDPFRRYGDASAVIRDLSAAMGHALPVETAATRESFLQAARFVGREAEVALLRGALDESMAGRGSAWLVSGESGVGKSRLIDEIRIRALVNGALVLRGQSVSEASPPYQVWREPVRRLALALELSAADAAALRPAAPDIAALLGRTLPEMHDADPEQARRRLQAALMSLFHRHTDPVVLILEDLHWAGSESLDALRELSESAARLPLLVVGSYRDEETPDLPERLPAMRTLPLHRLEPGAIAALSESMLGEGGRAADVLGLLQRETEGNVFFLIEVVRALAEEAGQLDQIGKMTLPAQVFTGGVRRIVARRLGKLQPGDQPVLQLAAIYGRELDLPVLRAAASIGEVDLQAWLTRAGDAAVLEVRDEQWRFAHDKLREGALEAIPADARPALHAHVARAIEHIAPNRVSALAYHWGMAGDRKRETHYTALAGEEADRVSAFPEAIRYFERALELTGDGDRAGRAALDVRLGRVLVRLNRHDDAIARLQEALDTARAPGVNAPRAAAAAQVYLGHAFRARGLPDDARTHYDDGLVASQDAGDRRLASESLRGLAHLAAAQGDYDAAIARLGDSLAICREIADQWGIANALSDLARVLTIRGAHEEAAQRLEEGLGIFRGLGDRRGMASALLNLGTVALYQGNPAGAVHHFEESLAISRQIGDRWNVAATLNNLGYVALSNGDFPRASASLAESLGLFREIGDRAAVAQTLINLGHVATQLDQDAEAGVHYHEALALSIEMDAAPLSLEIMAGMGRLRARAGQFETAAELAGLALSHPAVNPDVRAIAEPLVAELRGKLAPEVLEAALERGKAHDLAAVSAELLVLPGE